MAGYIKVTNWKQYQHYTKRNPPWVKFYRELALPSNKINSLPVPTRFLFDRLLLLAAEYGNAIPNDPELIASVLRMKPKEVREGLHHLAKGKWISQTQTHRRASKNASKMLSPETESRDRTPKSPTGRNPRPGNGGGALPFDVNDAAMKWLNGVGWDETFDQDAITEEIERIGRKAGAEGTLSLPLLLNHWRQLRHERYGLRAAS